MSVSRGLAQQGQTVRLGATFTLGGTLFDPFEVRQVQILASDGETVLATFSGAQIVHDSLGNFHVDWAIPSDEATDVHFDRWFLTASSGGTEDQETEHFLVLPFSTVSAGAAYLSVSEMRELLPGDSTLTDSQLSTMIAMAQRVIEEVTGRTFLPYPKTVTYDGNGRGYLPLGEPIISVSEARIIGCGSDSDSDTLLDVTKIRIAKSKMGLFLGNVTRRSDCRYGSDWPFHGAGPVSAFCGVWPSGSQNVAISGNWGTHTTVPSTIQGCLIQLVRNAAFCDDPLALPSHAFKSESIPGDRNYTLAEVWQNVKLNNMTGYPDIDRILSRNYASPSVGYV